MLEAVGHPVAVNPDRELARVARDRGWEIRQFVARRAAARARLDAAPGQDAGRSWRRSSVRPTWSFLIGGAVWWWHRAIPA